MTARQTRGERSLSAEALSRALGLVGYRVMDSWPSEADGRVWVRVEAPYEGIAVSRLRVFAGACA